MKKVDRFMVVDDDPTNNLICEYILKREFKDVPVTLFTVPEKGLEFISSEYTEIKEPVETILFLDINMPTISGWEFLEEFEKLPKTIQTQFTIFILSSSVDERDMIKAEINPLVSGFLCKPLSVSSIKRFL